MTVLYIVVAYDAAPTGLCYGTVASATSMEQAVDIAKTFAYVALVLQCPVIYVIRDASSQELYGPECQMYLLRNWQLEHC